MSNHTRKSYFGFAACIAVLLVPLIIAIFAASSYAKGVRQSRSDDDKKEVSKSSSNSQRNSEVRSNPPAPKPSTVNTSPSVTYGNKNERPSNSGQRYSSPRNEPAPKKAYTSPGTSNRSNSGTRVERDNPYNYRQPGNTTNRDTGKKPDTTINQQNTPRNDTRTKINDTSNTRKPDVSNDRDSWNRSDDAKDNRTSRKTTDIRTKSDNQPRNQQTDGITTRGNQSGIDRNTNDSGKNNRFGTGNNQPNIKDTRGNDGRNESSNRQFNSRDLPTTRNLGKDFRLPNDPRKNYRKEYEDIGNIWRQRSERRDTHRDRDRKHGSGINIIFNSPSFLHYCYDYRPLYSYPSVYCYYYDYFPPYIYGNRVLYYEPFAHRVRYNEITIFLNYPDDYYISDPSRRALNVALSDIEQAWEQKDIDRFMMYVRPKSTVAIFMKGDYSYSLDWLDYSDMTRDAMNSIDTKSFEFEKLTKRQRTGEITAYGRHRFYDWDGSLDTVYIRYTFERVSGEWYITEAETSSHKNW